jgi:hypothetical protein
MQYLPAGSATLFLSVMLVRAPATAPFASFVASEVSKFATTFVSLLDMVLVST